MNGWKIELSPQKPLFTDQRYSKVNVDGKCHNLYRKQTGERSDCGYSFIVVTNFKFLSKKCPFYTYFPDLCVHQGNWYVAVCCYVGQGGTKSRDL